MQVRATNLNRYINTCMRKEIHHMNTYFIRSINEVWHKSELYSGGFICCPSGIIAKLLNWKMSVSDFPQPGMLQGK